MRAVQITLLFVAAMLWLGAQAAQTEPNGPAGIEVNSPPAPIASAE